MARTLLTFAILVTISAAVPAQAPEPPLSDTRLTIHTLVREDVFAGFLQNDLVRLARAEKNIETLLASRPADRPGLLAWQGSKLAPEDIGVFAITGGSQVSLADRLPAPERTASWELSYTAYQRLWKLQEPIIEKLPLHHKGEVLSGLAQSAQRTGRSDEANAHLDRILTLMPDTVYANRARQWKDDPSTAAKTKLACQTCHAPGMLAARIKEVSQ